MFRYVAPSRPEGGGFGLVVGRFALVVAQDAGLETALRLWDALGAEGAAFEDPLLVIAELGAQFGAERMPDFALVERAATGNIALAARGRGFVRVDGVARHGADAEPWIEDEAPHASALSLGLGPDGDGPALPLGHGLVRTDELAWGTAPVSRDHATVSLELSDDDTVLGALRRRSAPLPADLPDQTVLGSRRSPAPHLGLVFESGLVIALDARPVVVGRAPRVPAGSDARPEPLRSPTRSVSGTHAELRLQGDTLLVTDLDSTNGTVVDAGGAAPLVLRGGAAARLSPGDRVDFGDGNVAVFGPLAPL